MKAYNKESNIFELQHLKMKLCYMSKMSIKQESSQTVKKKNFSDLTPVVLQSVNTITTSSSNKPQKLCKWDIFKYLNYFTFTYSTWPNKNGINSNIKCTTFILDFKKEIKTIHQI